MIIMLEAQKNVVTYTFTTSEGFIFGLGKLSLSMPMSIVLEVDGAQLCRLSALLSNPVDRAQLTNSLYDGIPVLLQHILKYVYNSGRWLYNDIVKLFHSNIFFVLFTIKKLNTIIEYKLWKFLKFQNYLVDTSYNIYCNKYNQICTIKIFY